MRRSLAIILALFCAYAAAAAPVGVPLTYRDGETELTGELFQNDTATPPRGGILVFHQWTGISAHERAVAARLAGEGFTVLCADVYGTGVRPQTPDACMAEVAKYKTNRDLVRSRAAAALSTLRADGHLGADRPVISIGYCFGGLCALEMARAGSDVRAVVSFHGALQPGKPTPKGAVKAKVLVLRGADDPYVPPAEIEAFSQEMKEAGAEVNMVAYPGAVHSFTVRSAGSDKTTGAAYDAAADEQSWAEFQKLLLEIAPPSK